MTPAYLTLMRIFIPSAHVEGKFKTTRKKQKEFKEAVFRLHLEMSRYFNRDSSIEELCWNMKKLNIHRFYKIWKNRAEFEEELKYA